MLFICLFKKTYTFVLLLLPCLFALLNISAVTWSVSGAYLAQCIFHPLGKLHFVVVQPGPEMNLISIIGHEAEKV